MLLIVAAILSILATAALPLSTYVHRRAQEEELVRALRIMRTAIDGYHEYAVAGQIRGWDVAWDRHPKDLEMLVEGVEVTEGEVLYEAKDLLALPPEERAREGIFMAFQYPVEIPGVSNVYFLKAALNATRKHRGLDELDAMDFLALIRDKMKLVEMDDSFLNRAVNEGFSGGEKKRNEIFLMAVLDPKLAVLDEIDSGLDIDALKIVAQGVNAWCPCDER